MKIEAFFVKVEGSNKAYYNKRNKKKQKKRFLFEI